MGGGFGAAFPWHKHPNCVVEAVADLTPERRDGLMKAYGCNKSYQSLEELVRDRNVDAVAVFSGAPDHVKHCVTALRAGKHVYVEKPLAHSIEECRVMVRVAREAGPRQRCGAPRPRGRRRGPR